MNKKLLGTALIAASASAYISGCGILETVDVPKFRFDSNSYVVQPGDTLESVASRYKIDPDSLVNINSLELAELIPGQRLTLLRDNGTSANAGRTLDTSGSGAIGGDATALGQSVVVPNATQTVTTPTTPDSSIINTDALLPPQEREEIVAVVNIPESDALLDQPIFVPDGELAASMPEVERLSLIHI